MRNFHKLAMIVVLGSGFAIAQSMPQQPGASQAPTSSQSPSSTTSDQSKPLPNTDQNATTGSQSQSSTSSTDQNSQTGQSTSSDKDKDKSGQSLPQSDASPNANANGDVQNTIQSAIQKDPTLSTANVTVDVKNGKSVTLNGTVPSKDAKDTAERIAKENSGGMKVKNHLKVASNNNDQTANPKGGDMSNPKH